MNRVTEWKRTKQPSQRGRLGLVPRPLWHLDPAGVEQNAEGAGWKNEMLVEKSKR